MPDLASPDGSAPSTSTLDTGIVPLGERALRAVLDHVVAVGDAAESTYLEAKGPLEMSSKAATAKIAKFLLGAANRRPKDAARHFHGYAVLVIGAQKGSALGVPRGTELHEIEDRLRSYLGSQFPAFEFQRITVSPDREVLFVVAQPPQDGQAIFPCHRSYQGDDRRDNLEDGAIYVRGTSNTRPARAGEVLALVERARGGGKPPISLDVALVGGIHRVDRVEFVLEQLLDYQEAQFSKMPETVAKSAFDHASFQWGVSVYGTSKPLSDEARKKALATWRSKKFEHIAEGRKHFLGAALPGASIRVVSHDRFVARPHLTLTFHNCELIDHLDKEDADFDKAVEPVLRTQQPFGSSFDSSTLRLTPRSYPVEWKNCGEDAKILLTPESFRPNEPWVSAPRDYVIVSRDPGVASVEASWVLTEADNDNAVKGGFQVPTVPLVDATDLFKAVFFDGKVSR